MAAVAIRTTSQERCGFRSLLSGLAVGGVMLILTIAKTMTTLPADGSAAVVFPPWSDSAANWSIIAATDARVVRSAAGGMVLVVISDRPGLAQRLKAFNVLAVLNPGGLGGCGGASEEDNNT